MQEKNYLIEFKSKKAIVSFARIFYCDWYINDKGKWVKDEKNFPAGSFYIGEIYQNVRHGKGKMEFPDGTI